MGNEKSSGIYVPGEPNNDAVWHYRLRQSRSRICLEKLHTCRHDTKAKRILQSHRCNTILPWALHPPIAGWLRVYVSRRPPNPKSSAFGGLPALGCKSRFFVPDKSEQFIHFGFFHFFGNRCIRQRLSMIGNPKRYGAVMYFQMSGNPTKTASINVHLPGLLAHTFRIAMFFRLRRVLALAVHTAVPL
jgi:hypothetical protein